MKSFDVFAGWPFARRATFMCSLVFVSLALVVLPAIAHAKEQTFQFGGSVEAGEIYTLRLRAIPAGTKLAVKITSDGAARYLLLDHDDRRRWPNPVRPLFDGRGERGLDFSAIAKATGHYYLVVDNRENSEPRKFKFKIHARYDRAGAAVRQPFAAAGEEPQELARLRENLRTYFVFEDFEFVIGRCNSSNVYASPGRVVICVEVAQRIRAHTSETQAAKHVLFFMTLHEVGHVLLRQWGYPFFDNEEIADEFATVLLLMFGREDSIRDAADFLEKLPSDVELEAKRRKDDRHPLSVQRARNLRRWLERPNLVRQWQKLLVPHMQKDVLVALKNSSAHWVDRNAIEKELHFHKAQ